MARHYYPPESKRAATVWDRLGVDRALNHSVVQEDRGKHSTRRVEPSPPFHFTGISILLAKKEKAHSEASRPTTRGRSTSPPLHVRGGAHHDAEESSDDDEKVDVGGTADLQASVASLSCGKDDVSSRDERRENGCTKDRDDSNDDSMEKPLSSLNNLEHNGSSRDYKNECLDSLSGLPKSVQPNVTVGPGMPHPHLLPYLYPPALYSSSMNHLPLSQLFLPGVTCSSGPSHPLPLSLFTSSGHPSPAAFTASHLAQSSLNSSSQGVGSLPVWATTSC
ncbi:optomotor-blind protein [Caerostris extrusa]|uniref:Optomotor-blind protein n=1 Tax=Caerostris extrusa TaxID=172846 RepID=A0AAV4UIK6_CAEEX|nr:optomotor-blind protein [Caerostris extrusa]